MATQTKTYEQVLTPPCEISGWQRCHVIKSKGRGGWVALAGVPVEQLAWAIDSPQAKGGEKHHAPAG